MQKKLYSLILVMLASVLFAGVVSANAVEDAASRIKQRLSQIDAMKSAGEVGEDAMGYLAERKPLAGRKASILSSENEDRRIIYESVSKQTGQPVSEVGKQRALQIAQRASSGVWLQKPSGEWYQKP